MDAKMKAYIKALPEPNRAICSRIVKLVLAQGKNIAVAMKWGNPTFCYKEKDLGYMRGMICILMSSKGHVTFSFMDGIYLKDQKKLLEGKGKRMRHIKIRAAAQIPTSQIKAWIKQEIAIKEAGPK